MSKAYSTDLFDLIKSLSPVEKAYIKKFAFRSSIKGNYLYLNLFDDIDRQKMYNERAILKKVKSVGALSQLKKYLYSAICKALDSYYAESSPRRQLIKIINMIDILYEKGLESQCRKLLVNAKKIALAHELYPYLIELLQWEKFVLSTKRDSEKELDKIYAEQQEHMKTYKTLCDYAHLNQKIRVVVNNNLSKRRMDEIAGYENFFHHPLFKSKEIPLSWKARKQFYEMKAYYYSICGNFHRCYHYRKESLLLFENFPEKKVEHLNAYLITLNNFLDILTTLHKYEEFEKYIPLFRSIPKYQLKNVDIIYGMSLLYSMELHFYLLRGEFEKGVSLVERIQADLEQNKGKMPKETELLLFINCAIVYFGVGNFSNALYWLNKMVMDHSLSSRSDISCFARILNLIAHFELGNIDMLEYAVKSTYRFLYKRGGLYKFEIALLYFIKNKITKSFNKKELKQVFIEFKGELEEIVKDPLEQKALESFDFISWLESKIQNRPFREVFREKLID